MVDYVETALRANADRTVERQQQEVAQRENNDAVIADFETTRGPTLSARLADTLGGSPSDPDFTALHWQVADRPVVERRDDACYLRPRNPHNQLYLETTFQGVRVHGFTFGEHDQAAAFAVVSTNGGMSQGFSDLASFGAAVKDVRSIGG